MMGVCSKIMNILINHNDIIDLIRTLQSSPCCAEDHDELFIQSTFDRAIKTRTMAYACLTESAVVIVVTVSLFCDVPQRVLPYKAWLPFSPTTNFRYWISYTHQILAHVFGALVNVAFDMLIPSLILQICCQFRLFEHRMLDMSKQTSSRLEKKKLVNCVRHHNKIFQLTEVTNNIFHWVIFLQFSISTIVICVTVYGLSKTPVSDPEFSAMILYLACMLTQIFVLCYSGTEITLQSDHASEAVYQIHWTVINTKTQKNLIMIMMRSVKPIKFTAGWFIDISINSFNQLVKLSYSAYNVLQRSSDATSMRL
uniref:Olfactory receptor 68 n=1 Tax=Aulacocentrum confusum TaxID=2767324 RepID=A0A7G8Z987_9HYME|nr:olfactory receptor 68 [Aulacocentrum confusum]